MGLIKKKNILIIAASVAGFFVIAYIIYYIVAVLIISGAFSQKIDNKRMEEIFIEDYEILTTVVDYFIDSGHTSIHIWPDKDNGFISVDSGKQSVSFNDTNIVSIIESLKAKGYSVIGRSDNIIFFQRSTRGRHFGNGIVYSIDGVEPNYGVNPRDPLYGSTAAPTQIMYLTKLEPLSKPNWYYYEEDYKEWQLRYQY